jgi:hypothetical protein
MDGAKVSQNVPENAERRLHLLDFTIISLSKHQENRTEQRQLFLLQLHNYEFIKALASG